MNEESIEYIQRLQQAYQQEQEKSSNLAKQTNQLLTSQQDNNLIKYQLEMDSILEDIQIFLRGLVYVSDDKGNHTWQEPSDKKFKIFNEYGVQEILRNLKMYINRNTILSNYDEQTIMWKVHDFGYELTDLIYTKYEDMFFYKTFEEWQEDLGYGKLTYEELVEKHKEIIFFINGKIRLELAEKEKLFPIVVRAIVDEVHSAYLRALNGGERESLRTARTVHQTEPLNQQLLPPNIGSAGNKFSMFRPSTWGK